MFPACRSEGEGWAIPPFDVVPRDVEGCMDELRAWQSAFHDGCARSEPRAHFFDDLVGPCRELARKSLEPMALPEDVLRPSHLMSCLGRDGAAMPR